LEHDKAHFQDTIKQKDQEIAFLQAHIAQLTQSISQLALPPSQEEARAKSWWQFWRW
jgi:cell division septum initiation protein DivIVA